MAEDITALVAEHNVFCIHHPDPLGVVPQDVLFPAGGGGGRGSDACLHGMIRHVPTFRLLLRRPCSSEMQDFSVDDDIVAQFHGAPLPYNVLELQAAVTRAGLRSALASQVRASRRPCHFCRAELMAHDS